VMRPELRRGDIFWVDWSPGRGSEQTGRRPALIVQADAANRHPRYPNTIVAAVSTKGRAEVSVHVLVEPSAENGLSSVSYVKCEQLQTVDKSRLEERLGWLSEADLARVEEALRIMLGL